MSSPHPPPPGRSAGPVISIEQSADRLSSMDHGRGEGVRNQPLRPLTVLHILHQTNRNPHVQLIGLFEIILSVVVIILS